MKFMLAGVLVLAGAASMLYLYHRDDPSAGELVSDGATNVGENVVAPSTASILSTTNSKEAVPLTVETVVTAAVVTHESSASDTDNQETVAFGLSGDVSLIGVMPLREVEYDAIIAELHDDPELFQQLLLEYRSVADPKRITRLGRIFEKFDDHNITLLGQDLVLSGDHESQKAGLVLLGGQQLHSEEARSHVADVLDTESDPEILISALHALAKPAPSDPALRQRLMDQFVLHTTNEDPHVRRRSLSLMSTWNDGGNLNSYFLNGLNDVDERVRIGALFSLLETKFPDDEVFQALVRTVEDDTVPDRYRKTALQGLNRYNITSEEKQNYLTAITGN